MISGFGHGYMLALFIAMKPEFLQANPVTKASFYTFTALGQRLSISPHTRPFWGCHRSERAQSRRPRRDRLAPGGGRGSEARPSTQRRLDPVAAGARQDVGRVGLCSS